jgi:hypothetical protein
MTNNMRVYPNKSTTILGLKIVVLFFALGGVGAVGGTKLMMLMNGGACLQGSDAGWGYLLASACLALPGMLLLRHLGSTADRSLGQAQPADAHRNVK